MPVKGTPAEISALAGHWEGEYASQATGRLGSIVFDLTAGEDHAHGDVLMIPRGSNEPFRPRSGGGGPPPGGRHAAPHRAVHPRGRGQGQRHARPLLGPGLQLRVTTTFVGTLRGDTIEGTFTSERVAGRVFGTWKATRKPAAIR